MARSKKPVEDDGPAGAPDWMVTFSDCMTLLLTFFVLLLSYSSFDDKAIRKLKGISFNKQDALSPQENNRDALVATENIMNFEELNEGSEKNTLERGDKSQLKKEQSFDFRHKKVFLWSSRQIFWGEGIIISSDGHKALKTIAEYLQKVPGRIVISENGPSNDKPNKNFGLSRAWKVMENLTVRYGLNKGRFSISSASTLGGNNIENDEQTLEIVILERDIYN